ncbi:MAG: sensor histidine kinase [Longimicrobiales bacterium]
MPVRTRLILTILGISLVLAVPAIFGAMQLRRLQTIANQQRSTHAAALRTIGRLQTALSELDRFARSYVSLADTLDITKEYRGVQSSLVEARSLLSTLEAGEYGEQARTTGEHVDSIARIMNQVADLLSQRRSQEATNYFEFVKPQVQHADESLDVIARRVDEAAREDLDRAARISRAAMVGTFVALLIAFGVVAILGYWATRVITTPVRRLRHSMARVAAGNYVVPENLPYQRRDEIGDLARSFSWMTQHLAKLDKMKAEFISIATHELKTPINVITGYTELVDEGLYGELTPDQKQALHAIRDQAHGLTRLVNQLLDVSRLEAGGLQLAMNEVVVEDLIESLERTFSVLANKKHIILTFSMGHNVPRSIEADPDRLRDQVLGNLLSNALKFTPERGHIGVRVWGDGPILHLDVSDTGVGIASDQLPYVFDKYYQIGQQARSKGAGLGLAIAREIVEAHGGHIAVESAENVGTTFRIELPVRQQVLEGEEVPAAVGADEATG